MATAQRLAAFLGTTLVLSASAATAATYAWQTAGGADWTNAANWNPPGCPQELGDEAVLPQIASATYSINLHAGNAITLSVLRVTSDAGQSYRVYMPVSTATRSEIFLENPNGNAQLLFEASAGAGKLTFDGNAAARHLVHLNDDLDIVVSNGTSTEDVEFNRTIFDGADRTITKSGSGNLRLYVNTSGGGLNDCTFNILEGQFTIAIDNPIPQCPVDMHEGTLLLCQYLGVGHRGGLIMRNNTTLRMQANGVSESKHGDITVHGSTTFDVQAGKELMGVYGMLAGTGTIVKTGTQTNFYVGTISPGFSAGTLTIDESAGAVLLGLTNNTVELLIEDGDLIELASFSAPVDLATIDATFLNATTPGMTNWFLTCDAGIANELNSVSFTNALTGIVIYDAGNGRVGAIVVPEPAILFGAAGLVIAFLRRR
ncbi:hypothetical protein GX586_15625 [bacterium]|nr:hypothetical protein [bacterium]